MKKLLLLYFFSLIFLFCTSAQTFQSPTYTDRGAKFLSTFKNDSLLVLQLPFNDTLRTRWERLPGQRLGL
ncbi:MAG: hypothetical protein ABI707_13770, partial [Ferruginibacter sp.]